MTDKSSEGGNVESARGASPRRHVAGMIALMALAAVAVAWFWTTRQPAQDAGLGLPHGIIVVGAGTFLAALMAEIRCMSLMDVLEMLWDLVLGLFSLIGVVLKGIWSLICGLFGWD